MVIFVFWIICVGFIEKKALDFGASLLFFIHTEKSTEEGKEKKKKTLVLWTKHKTGVCEPLTTKKKIISRTWELISRPQEKKKQKKTFKSDTKKKEEQRCGLDFVTNYFLFFGALHPRGGRKFRCNALHNFWMFPYVCLCCYCVVLD